MKGIIRRTTGFVAFVLSCEMAVPWRPTEDASLQRFDILLTLLWTDDNPESIKFDWVPLNAPLGRFAWNPSGREKTGIAEIISAEVAQLGGNWPLLRAGLFGGSLRRFLASKERVDHMLT